MSCATGFISIVDPFLNPDGSVWTGSITYTLLYATTAGGATLVKARQVTNISNGVNLCLAPGIYGVVYNQSGQDYPTTSQWNVPATGGPYTVATISQGVFPPAVAAGSDTEVQINKAGVLGADSTFTFDPTDKMLSLTGVGVDVPTGGGHIIGTVTSQNSVFRTNSLLFVSSSITSTTGPSAARGLVSQAYVGIPTPLSSNFATGLTGAVLVGSEVTGPLSAPLIAVIGTTRYNSTATAAKSSAFASSLTITAAGSITDYASFRAQAFTQTLGTITDFTSFLVETSTGSSAVSNRYGLRVKTLGIGTNRWSVYADTDPAYFGGGIQVPLTAPASSTATGTAGQIAWDANYVYVCVATNTWKRSALAAF